MTKEQEINMLIKSDDVDTNVISDGYHTFGELYEHRIVIYIALCRVLASEGGFRDTVWKSKKHSDGTEWDGWFILGIGEDPGEQITYHLPISKWNDCDFAIEKEKAPEWDKHTSEDVLNRIKAI